MNVTLYGQMLSEVKMELAQSQQAREELDTLFGIWRIRMIGHANYEAVLQDVFQTLTFHHREARELEKLHDYLDERLTRQGDPQHVVEFGKDGYPIDNPEHSAKQAGGASSRPLPKGDAPKIAPASQVAKAYYQFGSQGFAADKTTKPPSHEMGENAADEETLVEFAEIQADNTIYFDANGNPLTEYLAEKNRLANLNTSV